MTPPHHLRSVAAAGLLLLGLTGCGSDDGSQTPVSTVKGTTGQTTDKVEVKDFTFKPKDTTVKVGTTVTWTFNDNADHNVDPSGGAEPAKSPDLASGKTFTHKFSKPGTFEYRCGIHNSMTGSIVVVA